MKSRAENWMLVLCSAGLLCMILVSTASLSTQTTSTVPDFNGNGIVDFSDFVAFAAVFGVQQGDEAYDNKYDLDGNGEIDFGDFVIFARSFGKVVNTAPPGTRPPPGQGNSPDLVVATPSVDDSSLDVGESFTLSATVRNNGSGSSSATTLRYYLSTDATISDSDTQIGTDAVSILGAFEASDQSVDLKAPSTAGTYYYGACVDVVTGESSNGNNCSGAVMVTVGGGSPPPAAPEVTIAAGTTPVTEGTAATFTITVSPAPASALTVNVKVTADGDVIGGTPYSTVTIDANKGTATLAVITVDDQADEANSVVTVRLQGGTGYTVGGTSSASVTVNDNDPPQVTISAGTSPVREGTAATFTITASSAPASALSVGVSVTQSGDVISGTPSSSVTIDANKTTATLTVATDDDGNDESSGVVTAQLQSGTGYTVGSTFSASVTVNDNDIPQVTISAGTTPVTEGTAATFTISASPAPASALTVTVNVTETGDVIGGTPSTTVTIDAAKTTTTLTVNTVNDEADEPNSKVTAKVETGTGYTVDSAFSASVTVNDNDIPQVTISAGTTPVTEGTAATFTISASPAPASALTVTVNVTETGDVIGGTPSTTVTIDAAKTTTTLTVNTVNDEADEPNSKVTAKVETGTGYTVDSAFSASVTVNDNDDAPPGTPVVTIAGGTPSVTEGTAATFTITVSPAPASALTVNVKVTEDGDVIGGTPYSTVTIDANKGTATLAVNTVDDQADEANSVVTARLQGGTGYTVGSTSPASVTVNDNDPPQVTISAGTSPVREGTAATFTITASSAPTSALSVGVSVTQSGDVISGTPSSSVTIDANKTTATLTVATDDDSKDESNGVVTAQLQSGTGYTLDSTSSASVTVNDDDIPQVTIAGGTPSVTEGTAATFTITVSPAPASALTVNVKVTEDGDVIGGTPYSTVTIDANKGTATLAVNTVDDQADEANGVVTAQLQSGTGYTLGSTSSASVTVNDNDPPQVTISAGTSPVTEGTAATFTITASSAPTSALSVGVSVTQSGDVISGTPSSSVTIDANKTTATLTVATDDDGNDESSGVVTAQLQSGTGYTVGSTFSASVMVNDNDIPQVTISAGTTPVTEGTAATFTISASPAPASALTVTVNVTETGDVIGGTPSTTVTIDAAKTTTTLTVNTVNDEADEPNSKVTAKVETGTGYTVDSAFSASVTVNDNDDAPPGTPVVTIAGGTPSVTEGTAATFTITVSPAPASALTVNVKVTEDGDVIGGTPYSTVTIDANKGTATLAVNTVDDQADEANSVVTARLQDGTGYTLGSTSSASVTVNDNDPPQVTISAGTSPVREGTAATFTITASSAPTSALSVGVSVTQSGDVISGTPSSSVTIDANKTTATLTVATDDDGNDESSGVVTAQLQSGTGYTLDSTSSASVTVNDDDIPQVTIAGGTPSVTEGTAATFTITVSPAPASALTVNVKVTEDGDVIGGTPYSTVTIDANKGTATLAVNTVDDQADEANGVVTAQLQSGTGYTLGSTSSASVTVNDNDPPQVTISAGTSPVTEGTAATFTITASSAPTSALSVGVSVTQSGDVISGTPSSSVTIDANKTTATLTVATDDDSKDESNGVVTAQLQSGTGYTVGGTSSAGVTVNDNDPPQVTISAGTSPVTEGTAATFTITASSAPTSALSVGVSVTQSGDVISGTPSSSVTIDANKTTATLTVATDDDGNDESSGVVTAQLQSGTGYTLGSTSSASVTVNDNDPPQVTISAGTSPVTEGAAATFTITASSAPTSALSVGVSVTQSGDVISGTPSSSVTIDANKTTATLAVATDDDGNDESSGVVTAQLQSGTGYTLGSTSSATVTVNDNDERLPAASVVISPDTLAFTAVGASATLTGRILDANGNATYPTSLGWTSANREVATVTSLTSLDLSRPKATVKAIGGGTTTITLGVDDDVTGTATVTVTLMGRRVEISPGRLRFDALGQTKMVTVKVLYENDDEDTEASFSASSAFSPLRGTTIGDGGLDIEKVDGGIQITANANGIGSVTISSAGAESAILHVSAAQSPASLVVSPDSVGLAVGATATLSAAISDANGHGIVLDQGDGQGGLMVSWETSDSAVATVTGATATNDSNTGGTATVSAAGAGAATITGRWGSYIRGTAKVTVTAGN